jgi:enterochelin esterase-like enzyme
MRVAAGVLTLIGCLAGGLARCSAADPESWVNPPGKPPPGVQHKTFRSNSMKHDVGYNIYLPPEYARSDRRFPVVYLLHGGGGHESRHFFPIAAQTLDGAIKAKQMPPCICVFAMAGRTSLYCDSPDGKVMGETVVIKELIPHIDKNYRTIAARGGRALEGMSMGGFGALKFAFKYPNMFSSAVAYAPGLWQSPLGFQEEEVRKILKHNLKQIRGAVGLRIVIGEDDHLNMHGAKLASKPEDHRFLENNRKLHALLDQLHVPHEYLELPKCGHDCNVLVRKVGLDGFRFNAGHFRLETTPNPLPARQDRIGWVPLFNGTDLTGWTRYADHKGEWGVKDGALGATGPLGYLFSDSGDYENFHIRIDAKINAAGNSGLFIRCQPGKGHPRGYEAQINISSSDPVKTGSLYPDGRDKYTAEEKKKMVVLEQLVKPDEWFTQEVIAVGNHIVIRVNGKTAIDFVDEKNRHTKGHLAIQHASPATVIEVRKVEVKRLPATEERK